jgi:hypothetical protein
VEKNPGYFEDRYAYVKEWRRKKKDSHHHSGKMRQDTPIGINADLRFVDTGGEDGSDTRRDNLAKAWWQYVCCIWLMIQDEMDWKRQAV